MRTVDLTSVSRLAENELTKFDHLINTDDLGAIEKFNDIWNESQIELCDKYSLPAFHLWEDGFCKGDASDDEIVEAVKNINDIEDEMQDYPEWEPCPVVSCEINEEDDELETDIFFFLDNKFEEIISPKIENLISEYNDRYSEEYQNIIKEMDENSLSGMNN